MKRTFDSITCKSLEKLIPFAFYKLGTEILCYVEKKSGWYKFRKCRIEILENVCIITKNEIFRTEESLFYLKRANEIDFMVEVIEEV